MDRFECVHCGNKTNFHCSSIERHDWLVDCFGEFVSDLGCYDSSRSSDIMCAECGKKAEKVKVADEGKGVYHGYVEVRSS